jgi:hypothetical protein
MKEKGKAAFLKSGSISILRFDSVLRPEVKSVEPARGETISSREV